MTPEQQQWVRTMSAVMKQKPVAVARPPTYGCVLLYDLISSTAFDGFITFIILANIGVMACDYWQIKDDTQNNALYLKAMRIFVYVYYVEATLKIIALGPKDALAMDGVYSTFFSLDSPQSSSLLPSYLRTSYHYLNAVARLH